MAAAKDHLKAVQFGTPTVGPDGNTVDGGGGGGDDGGMETERRLTALETLMPMLATKADVAEVRADIHKAVTDMSRWNHAAIVGMLSLFGVGLLGLLFTIWNANKSSLPPAATAVPIIIQIPSAPAPVPPAAIPTPHK
jgi:hypothetical protein